MTHDLDSADTITTIRPGLHLLESANISVVVSEESSTAFTEPLAQALLSAVSKPIKVAELRSRFQDVPPIVLNGALAKLYDLGVIEVNRENKPPATAAFWRTIGRQPADVEVHLHDLGAPLAIGPELLDTPSETSGPGKVLHIISTDDYLRPEVGDVSRENAPVLLVRPVGRKILIGPLLNVPGAICYECLSFWLRLHRWRQELALLGEGSSYLPAPAVAALPSTRALAASLAAIAIEQFGAGDIGDMARGITAIDAWAFEKDTAPLLSRANCHCKTVQLGDTALTEALAHPLTGLLDKAEIQPIPGSRFFTGLAGVLITPGTRRNRAWEPVSATGTGEDRVSATRSLVFEAVERYSTIYDGEESLGRRDGCAWVTAHALPDDSLSYVPAGDVYLDYPGGKVKDSTGCAAGVTVEDAVRRALLELIERDALALWWWNQVWRDGLDVTSECLTEVAGVLATDGRSINIIDISTEISVPVVAAVSADAAGRRIYIGAAADSDPVRAAERAALEMLQFWFWDRTQQKVPASRSRWLAEASFQSHPFLNPPRLSAPTSTCKGAVANALAEHGIEVKWVDLTRPELGIPVVRVLAPALCQLHSPVNHARFEALPKKLGWRVAGKPNEHYCPL